MKITILTSFFIYALGFSWFTPTPISTTPSTANCPLQVAFEYEVDGLNVTFINTSQGKFDRVAWTLGDGTTSAVSDTVRHTYKEADIYTFCLNVAETKKQKCDKQFCGKVYVFDTNQ